MAVAAFAGIATTLHWSGDAPDPNGPIATNRTTQGPASPVEPEARPAVHDIETYSGRWMVPSVDWSVVTVGRLSAAEMPSSWRLVPLARGARWFRVETTATRAGELSCLTLVDESVELDACSDGTRAQEFHVGQLDFENQVSLSGLGGTLNASPDGSIYLGGATEPSAVFTLHDPRPE